MNDSRSVRIAYVLLALFGCGTTAPTVEGETSAVQAIPEATTEALANEPTPTGPESPTDSARHEAIIAYEDAVRPLLDEHHLAALPNRTWPTDPAELTCELSNSSARLLPLIDISGALNLNWGAFEHSEWSLTRGSPAEKLETVRFFQRATQRYVDEDCSAARPSAQNSERRANWDWKCHDPSTRVGFSAAFDQALESCAAAEELLTACAESRPANAALGALAASIEVAAYRCFFREGAGWAQGTDFGPGLVRESIAGLPSE